MYLHIFYEIEILFLSTMVIPVLASKCTEISHAKVVCEMSINVYHWNIMCKQNFIAKVELITTLNTVTSNL